MLGAAPPPPLAALHQRVRMRDGVRLCTNVFRPAGVKRGPVLLVRTPYGKPSKLTGNYEYFAAQGYALVVQDVRGRFDSEGRFTPIDQETADGEDTLNWIGRQPWCDGNVGMIGGSYLGITQWRAALGDSPFLKAIFPVVAGSDEYLDRYYSPGGALKSTTCRCVPPTASRRARPSAITSGRWIIPPTIRTGRKRARGAVWGG